MPTKTSSSPTREDLLQQLKSDLARYLSDAADRVTGLTGLSDILALEPGALEQALAYRLITSPEAELALHTIESLLPFLPPTRGRSWIETRGFVRGNVSWMRTQQRQAASSDPTIFVSSVPEKRYDTNVARLAKLVLELLVSSARRSRLLGATDNTEASELQRRYLWALRHLRYPKLGSISTVLRQQDLEALAARPQLTPLTDVVNLHHALFQRRDSESIAETMDAVVLAPRATPALYELFVAFRLVEAFEQLGFVRRRPWGLLGGTAPVAELSDKSTRVVIHWQRALSSLNPRSHSLAGEIAASNGVSIGVRRPDIIVEIERSGERRLRFGEVKYYSKASEGVSVGIMQGLAYIKDLESIFTDDSAQPLGFVVVAGLESRPTASLITVGSDEDLESIAAMLTG